MTALAGVAVMLAGGVVALQHAFADASSSDPVFAGLRALTGDLFALLPFVALLLVGAVVVQAVGGLR